MRIISALIVAMLFSENISAQNTKQQGIETPFTAAFFEKRLPDFYVFKKENSKDGQTALLFSENIFSKIELYWKKEGDEKDIFWLVVTYKNDAVTLRSLSFQKNNIGQLTTNVDIASPENQVDKVPLELCFLPSNNIILYRWINAKTASSQSGAIPQIKKSPISVGTLLPECIITSLSNDTLTLNDIKDQVIVINWWAINCRPCVDEIPGLNDLVEKYKDKRVEFIAIAWNKGTEIQEFLKKKNFTYKQFTHTEKMDSIFGESFPRNIVVNQHGIVVYDRIGGSINSHIEIEEGIKNALH